MAPLALLSLSCIHATRRSQAALFSRLDKARRLKLFPKSLNCDKNPRGDLEVP